ncbi:MAG: glucose-6-phosphate isomerase [Bacilli bacterium]|nr:glucose-6-phosphate isomerase [Bacilli bacterium]
MIKFDFETYANKFVTTEDRNKYNLDQNKVKQILNPKNNMTGWYDLDSLFNKNLIVDINNTASFIRQNCDIFLIIGIGGSYLGTKAVIEALQPYFYNEKTSPKIYFVGNNLSSDYYHDLISLIKDKNIIVNVISKSGNTLETKVAYQLIMDLMKSKYQDEELRSRVIITTDKENGSLRVDAHRYRYKSYIIPNNVGGRYSVFTPVGLLPLAVAGLNLNDLYLGAKEANNNIDKQIEYAVTRDIMYNRGKQVEAFIAYEPKLESFLEWLKQLYGESLGKDEKGILPVSYINTRDLHSLGQFIQQGNKILFETVIDVAHSDNTVRVQSYNRALSELNNIAFISTSRAHNKANVLNNIITIERLCEKTIGYLIQFFMISCAISGYIGGINPFDQDGVEEYKSIMETML